MAAWTYDDGTRVAGVRAVSLRMAGESVAGQSVVLSHEPIPGKGGVPAPAGTKKVIVGTATAGPVAAGGSFWDWVAVHPYETAAIGCGIGIAVGGAIYALNRWHQHRQEAPIPNTPFVPELKAA
jgi:hypothetical protein